jgi:hypothetical protein
VLPFGGKAILAQALKHHDSQLPPRENTRYHLRSCSHYILLVCRPIHTLKTGQNGCFEMFARLWQPESRLKTTKLPVLEVFLSNYSGHINQRLTSVNDDQEPLFSGGEARVLAVG